MVKAGHLLHYLEADDTAWYAYVHLLLETQRRSNTEGSKQKSPINWVALCARNMEVGVSKSNYISLALQ